MKNIKYFVIFRYNYFSYHTVKMLIWSCNNTKTKLLTSMMLASDNKEHMLLLPYCMMFYYKD